MCPTTFPAARPGAGPSEEQAQYPPEQQAYAAAPPGEDARDKQIAQLKELAELKTQGILTEEEFAAQKAEILGG